MKKSKYMNVYDYLLNYMRENQLQYGDKLPTEKELTERFNVSRITVQKALDELIAGNYLYRRQGSGTFVNRSFNAAVPRERAKKGLGVIPMVIAYDGYSNRGFEIIQGAERYFSEHETYLTIHTTNADSVKEREIIEKLIGDNFTKLLVMPANSVDNRDFFASLARRGVTCVFVDHTINDISVSYVASDNISGGYLITKNFIDEGHRRIALVSPNIMTDFSTFRSRLTGYKNALHDAEIPFDAELVFECRTHDEFGGVVRKIAAMKNRPTAVFVLNDLEAISFLKELTAQGYSVPGDFALAGYDNLEMIGKQDVGISTVDQDFFQMGYLAAEVLAHAAETENGVVTIKKLPVKLIAKK